MSRQYQRKIAHIIERPSGNPPKFFRKCYNVEYEQLINNTILYIEALFAGNADGHDAEHSLRVYKNALAIASGYPECDLLLISLASLLHDVDDHKLFHTENNSNARTFLKDNGILDELEKLNIGEGDTVRMYGFSFEYYRNADTEVPEIDDETDEDEE